MDSGKRKAVRLFMLVIVFYAVAGGLGNAILANYFKEV